MAIHAAAEPLTSHPPAGAPNELSFREELNSKPYKTFTVSIDAKFDRVLNDLKVALGKPSRAEVCRLAVALLKLAVDARANGQKVVIANNDDVVIKEILLPG